MMTLPLKLIEIGGLKTTEGALRIMQTDPHGWILVVVSVSVVFCCLLILFCVYSAFGAAFTGKFKRKKKPEAPACQDEGERIAAAVALALYLQETKGPMEQESGVITIAGEPGASPWADKSRNFRSL